MEQTRYYIVKERKIRKWIPFRPATSQCGQSILYIATGHVRHSAGIDWKILLKLINTGPKPTSADKEF